MIEEYVYWSWAQFGKMSARMQRSEKNMYAPLPKESQQYIGFAMLLLYSFTSTIVQSVFGDDQFKIFL